MDFSQKRSKRIEFNLKLNEESFFFAINSVKKHGPENSIHINLFIVQNATDT